MSRVRAFFLREAGECLSDMAVELERSPLDIAAVYGAVRRFRGSAQMARFGGLTEQARALEARLRPHRPGRGRADNGWNDERSGNAWEEALRREVRTVMASLEREVEAVRDGRLEEDPRMEAGMEQHGGGEMDETMDVVPIDTLEYQGHAALRRAMELREALEDAFVSESPPGPILDELFDLIRLGAK